FPFKSAGKSDTFSKSLKNGVKNTRVKIVSFTLGYWAANAFKTGTVIATSPMAESRMTRMCVGFSDIILLCHVERSQNIFLKILHFVLNDSFIFGNAIQDSVRHRCTSSFACTLSCICRLFQYQTIKCQ